MSVIKSEQISGNCKLHPLILDHSAADVRRDWELTVLACKEEGERVCDILDADSQECRPIVAAMTESDEEDDALQHVPLLVQSMHPDLALKVLQGMQWPHVEFCAIAGDLRPNVETQ